MKKNLILFSILMVFVGCKRLVEKIDRANPAAPPLYYNQTQTTLPVEQKYTRLGGLAISSQVFPSKESKYKEYKVWYPQTLTTSNEHYPVVVFANGSGVKYYRYEDVFEHLASWGFVVIGNDDPTSFSGESTSKALALLDQLNGDKNSLFYGKLATQNAGISGHSQGGVGAINAATKWANSSQVKAVFTASALREPAAAAINWNYDISKIRVPYFAIAGTGRNDAGTASNPNAGIAPLPSMIDNQAKINSGRLTVRARRKNNDHPEMLYVGDGYMTAFFRYTLMNDADAGQAFMGTQPEIARNANWQDVDIKNGR